AQSKDDPPSSNTRRSMSVAEDRLRPQPMAGVAAGIFLKVILMVILGLPPFPSLDDLGHDRLAEMPALVEPGLERLGLLALLLRVIEDRGAVGGSHVVALTVQRRRVVHAEIP